MKLQLLVGTSMLLGACGSGTHSQPIKQALPRASGGQVNQARPGRPIEPCVFPTASEIGDLKAESDSAVVANVSSAMAETGSDGQTYTRYHLHIQQVLFGTADGTDIVETGGVPVPLMQAGPYVLFLKGTTDGQSVYVVNGMSGLFPLRNGNAMRDCANGAQLDLPRQADGQMSASSFAATVQQQAVSGRTKKG
jgi:hypothetical protein